MTKLTHTEDGKVFRKLRYSKVPQIENPLFVCTVCNNIALSKIQKIVKSIQLGAVLSEAKGES